MRASNALALIGIPAILFAAAARPALADRERDEARRRLIRTLLTDRDQQDRLRAAHALRRDNEEVTLRALEHAARHDRSSAVRDVARESALWVSQGVYGPGGTYSPPPTAPPLRPPSRAPVIVRPVSPAVLPPRPLGPQGPVRVCRHGYPADGRTPCPYCAGQLTPAPDRRPAGPWGGGTPPVTVVRPRGGGLTVHVGPGR